MPTIEQNIVESAYPGNGSTGDLGKSNQSTLAEAFPSALHHQNNPAVEAFTGKDANAKTTVNYTNHDLKVFYKDFVMGDGNPLSPLLAAIPGSYWSTGVSLDYQGAPDPNTLTTPEGEEGQGETGSTIAASGLGPNVATLNINSNNPAEGIPFVDAGANEANPDNLKPSQSSNNISTGDVHGGGVLGSSPQSV